MENFEDFEYVVTDTDGVEHTLSVIGIFHAGNLNREYVAGYLKDVELYRYEVLQESVDVYKYIIKPLDNENQWERVQNMFLKPHSSTPPHEDTVYVEGVDDYGNKVNVPMVVTILDTINVSNNEKYIALMRNIIMFHRWTITEKDGQDFLEIEDIYSAQELADVQREFERILAEDAEVEKNF